MDLIQAITLWLFFFTQSKGIVQKQRETSRHTQISPNFSFDCINKMEIILKNCQSNYINFHVEHLNNKKKNTCEKTRI